MRNFISATGIILALMACDKAESPERVRDAATAPHSGNRAAILSGVQPSVGTLDSDGSKPREGETAPQAKPRHAATWKKITAPGSRWELIDSSAVQSFQFVEDKYVLATLGTNDAVTGPILHWEIRNSALVFVSESSAGIVREFQSPRLEGNPKSVFGQTVRVLAANGTELRFKFTKVQMPGGQPR